MITFPEYVRLANELEPRAKVRGAASAFLSLANFSAVAVTVAVPGRPRHEVLFSDGYPEECLQHVCTSFVIDDPFYRRLAQDPRPIGWTDLFRSGFEASAWLRPAGYRNGSSLAMRDGRGAEIGSIHANTRQEDLSDRQLEALTSLREFLAPLLEQWLMHERLTVSERELEVIGLIVEGDSNAEIAASLHITPRTVATHIENVMRKLGVHSRVEVAVTALRLGLV